MRCGKGIEAAETLCVIFCPLKLHFSLKNLKTLYGLSFSKLWYQTHSLTACELVSKQTTASFVDTLYEFSLPLSFSQPLSGLD